MDKIILELSSKDVMKVEAIIMDNDSEEALRFLEEVIRPKLRAKTSTSLDMGRSTGIIT